MTKLDVRVAALLRRVGSDASSAAELLAIAAACFEARELLPDALADHLANSFKRTAVSHRDERVSQLGYELGLTTTGATSKHVEAHDVAEVLARNEGLSETALKAKVSKAHKVSPSTALKHVKKAKTAQKLTRDLIENTGALVVRNPRGVKGSG